MDPKDDERRKFPRLHREDGDEAAELPVEDGDGEDDSDDEVFLIGDD